jgi:hypothetical protein
MRPRFGLDANKNGIVDMPNTRRYALNGRDDGCPAPCNERVDPTFTVRLESTYVVLDPGLRSAMEGQTAVERYHWTIRPAGSNRIVRERGTADGHWSVRLAEGLYDVTVEVTVTAGGRTATDTGEREVLVDDILIVAMGDSYASGEGNPAADRRIVNGIPTRAIWGDDGRGVALDSAVDRDHYRAHRSTHSWPAIAALALEQRDPHTSVTFLHFAASGATIHEGILNVYDGAEDPFDAPPMPAQVTDVGIALGCTTDRNTAWTAASCDREIDALLVSIGGNDAGFGDIVAKLILADPVVAAATGGGLAPVAYQAQLDEAWAIADRGLGRLPDSYQALDRRIQELLRVFHTYLMEYPDPTGDLHRGDPVWCDEIVGDVVFGLEVDVDEQKGAISNVLGPLNDAGAAAAWRHGWSRITGVAEEFGFRGHGYCAPSSRRWFRTAEESQLRQGPGICPPAGGSAEPVCIASRRGTKGTLHPTTDGHRAEADFLLKGVVVQNDNPAAGYRELDDRMSGAQSIRATAIEGDAGPCDGATCVLSFPRDVDLFRMLVAGRNQTMRFEVEPYPNSIAEPRLRLFDRSGRDITPYSGSCPTDICVHLPSPQRFSYTFPEAGTYYLGVSARGNEDYDPRSGLGDRNPTAFGRGLYRLRVFDVAGTPDNTIAKANSATLGTTDGYAIQSRIDVDMFRVDIATEGRLEITADSAAIGPDAVTPGQAVIIGPSVAVARPSFAVALFDASGRRLARGIDGVSWTVSAGAFYVGVSAAETYDPSIGVPAIPGPADRTGPYRLEIRRLASQPSATSTATPGRVVPGRPAEPPRANKPPEASDASVRLPSRRCAGPPGCSWMFWLSAAEVIDPDGDAWIIDSFTQPMTGAVDLVECEADPEHGCFVYTSGITQPVETRFKYVVTDPDGSGRRSRPATIEICAQCG